MTVKLKLIFLVGFSIVALTLVGLVGNGGIQGCATALEEVGKVRLPSIVGLEIINEAQTAIRMRTIETAIWENDYKSQEKFADVVERKKAAWSRVDKGRKIYEPLPQTPEEALLWKQFEKEWDAWKAVDSKLTQTMTALSQNKQESEQKRLFATFYDQYEAMRPLYNAAETTLGKVVELNIKLAEEEGKSSDATISFSRKSMIATGLIAIIVALLLGMAIMRAVTRPLNQMQTTIEEVERSGDYSKQVPVDSRDEIGQTASAFNALMETLRKSIGEVNGVVSAIAAGDFSRRVEADLKGDLQTMKVAVNASAESVKVTMDGLNEVMKALYNGDFSQRMSTQVKGEFKLAVDQAMQAMQAMLGDVGGVMAKVSNGDLSQRITAEGRGDLARLKENINASLVALSSVMKAVGQNTQQVAAASNQTSNAIGQISDGAQNQMHAINQVATAVQQTAAAVTEVARSAESANTRAQGMGKAVNEGIADMNRMVEIVQAIATNADRIDKITDVIEKIANKTNLLSLNAAIEAARAGEHGKGFAVVAEEVGKLAASAGESTQEIAALVKQAVEDADRATGTVAVVNKGMQEISNGARQTEAELQRISAAMEQQNAAITEINANVGSLNRIASANASAAEEITSTVIELARLADGTRREVEKFST